MLKIRAFSFSVFGILFTFIALALNAFSLPGDVDLSFSPGLYYTPGGCNTCSENINAIVRQADGKFLLGGQFEVVNGIKRRNLVRLNADFSLDTSFNPPLFQADQFNNRINVLALQADGKILVGGRFLESSTLLTGFVRLNSDGSVDSSFTQTRPSGEIFDIKVLSDNKILLAGFFSYAAPGPILKGNLTRLLPDGTDDSTFNGAQIDSVTVYQADVLPDGKILAAHAFGSGGVNGMLRRLNANGLTDTSFSVSSSGLIRSFAVQNDGKIVLGGNFNFVNNFSVNGVARINSDGTFDSSFNSGNNGTDNGTFVYKVKNVSGGKLLVSGNFNSYNGQAKKKILRLNADGTLDTAFDFPAANNSFVQINNFIELSDGKILVGGRISISNRPGAAINLLNNDGSLDSAVSVLFGSLGAIGKRVIIQPNGKILVAGDFSGVNNLSKSGLVRFNADGTLDNSFNASLTFVPSPVIDGLALQTDGKILVGGNFNGKLKRLNADGSEDLSFAPALWPNAVIKDIVALANGDILVGGANITIPEVHWVKFNSSGTRIDSFNQPNGEVYKITLQPDGKMLIGGNFTLFGGQPRGYIARINSNGFLDLTFAPLGANFGVYAIAVQADGKIMVGGAFTTMNGNGLRQYLARLNSDGSLDTGFLATVDAQIYDILIQNNGKIVIGGGMTGINGHVTYGIGRMNQNSTPDTTFVPSPGAFGAVRGIAKQADGKLVIAGAFSQYNSADRLGIARLQNDDSAVQRTTKFDFDGDGKADSYVFRPSTNAWYIIDLCHAIAEWVHT